MLLAADYSDNPPLFMIRSHFVPASMASVIRRLPRSASFVLAGVVVLFLLGSSQIPAGDVPVEFLNVAEEAGLTISNIWGGVDFQRYIIEVKGCGLGFYDNDGDVDVLILNMNDPPSLLKNDGGNQGNWTKIKLVGTTCNRSAIGARVRVVTGDHAQIDEVQSGGSVMSQNDLRLHFGLGKANLIDSIEVLWPTTQEVESFAKVEANQILTIVEGSGIVKRK